MPSLPLLAALLLQQESVVAPPPRRPLPRPGPNAVAVAINDNRRAAGAVRRDTLVVELDVVEARWKPEGEDDPEVPILAFAERGRAPLVPAPLIRGRTGTPVRVVLRSRVDSALVIRDLRAASGGDAAADTVQLAPRGTREVRFTLGAPGSYFYYGAMPGLAFGDRDWLDSQLTGALVVDPASGAASDRVFVVTEWFQPSRDGVFESALVFNGKAWPHTERLTYTEGDSVRWRLINAAAVEHPMHLHGFYYRVTSRGTPRKDVPVPVERQSLINTEVMPIGGTMALAFLPTTPGNWVFHCHFAVHVNEHVSLAGPRVADSAATLVATPAATSIATPVARTEDEHATHDGRAAPAHAVHQMRGLVLGIHVLPGPGARAASTEAPRDIRLLVQRGSRRIRGHFDAYGFVVQRDVAPARDSVQVPGPVLELKRGQPVRITVVNNLTEPTGVHWHGLEIESFPDGVPGWSGTPGRIMPPIAPGDSFVAEFTPPRAGTFLYHSHLHELVQIESGMYGAIVVTDGPRDTATDHIVIAGGGGPVMLPKQESPYALVNGRVRPRPLRLAAGRTHRLRIVSIHPEWVVDFALVNDSTVARWRAVAKDGADLPPALVVDGPARTSMGPGETADFEFTPTTPGRWRMEVRSKEPGWYVPLDVIIEK